VAPLLAKRLGCASVDLDREIERQAGRPVAAIFDGEGEARFRDLESLALAQALHGDAPVVVSCGGGVLGRAANWEVLRARARVVWLTVSPEEAAARLDGSEEERPLLRGGDPAGRLAELLSQRAEAYGSAADLRIETSGLAPEEIAARVAAALA
jgi:shikimate kinase